MVENIVGKGENAGYQHFLLFPQCFQKSFSYGVVKGRDCVVRVNPFPNKPYFSRVCSTSLLKTLWRNEKLLLTINFSFPHNVFYHLEEHYTIIIKFKVVVCKLFHFGSLNFVVWERVKTLSCLTL